MIPCLPVIEVAVEWQSKFRHIQIEILYAWLDMLVCRPFSLMGLQVAFASDCIGEEVQKGLSGLKNGEVGIPSLYA